VGIRIIEGENKKMKVEIKVQVLVDKIEEIRKNEIMFQHTMKSTDPNWLFMQGKITSLDKEEYKKIEGMAGVNYPGR